MAEQRGSPPLSTRCFPGLAGWGRQGLALKGEVQWQVRGALEPAQGPGERPWSPGKAEKKACSSQTSRLPISRPSGPGWGRAASSDWAAAEGAGVQETQGRAEGVLPRPTGPGTGQEQGTRASDGGQQPAWLRASLRVCCCPRSGKHLRSYFQTSFQGPFKQEKPRDNEGCISLKTVFH